MVRDIKNGIEPKRSRIWEYTAIKRRVTWSRETCKIYSFTGYEKSKILPLLRP